MPANRHLARVLAVQGLYQHILMDRPVEDLVSCDWHTDPPLDEETRSYAADLMRGTVLHREEIERIVRSKLAKTDLDHVRLMDRIVLYLSVYSLLHCPDIPPKVVINEGVILAKEFGNDNSYKFINGILDAVAKETRSA